MRRWRERRREAALPNAFERGAARPSAFVALSTVALVYNATLALFYPRKTFFTAFSSKTGPVGAAPQF
jgi:hypothetical protein